MKTLELILERINAKQEDYRAYDFKKVEDDAFKSFFDLAQEFDELEDLYALCVAIPRGFFDLDARLYMLESKGLRLVAGTKAGAKELHKPPPKGIHPEERPYYTRDGSAVFTIHGKQVLMDQLPYKAEGDIIGILEIYPVEKFDTHRELFFEKFANRIGFNVHNRFLVQKNIEHLKFIQTLVADIEHNIIVPNMFYKLFLRDLKSKILKAEDVESILDRLASGEEGQRDTLLQEAHDELKEANKGLMDEFNNIESHYKNMSLFLETLLRRSHFDQGRLILRTKSCNMEVDVVRPQLERYRDKFKSMGINVDHISSGIPDEDTISVVDVGLMAQVYANLFSNAVKYTREVDVDGKKLKYVSYGYELLPDYGAPGKDGVKYNVFSTGPHISDKERKKIFKEGYRGVNSGPSSGTGHGLTFVKNVVEMHGGSVGYEPTENGNNFYFILPRV